MGLSPDLCDHGGTISGRYSIRRKLGTGSLGTVYLAYDAARRQQVALKVIRSDRLTSRSVERLQREFRALASLDHRQIATAYDFGYTEKEGLPFYTHEYIAGAPMPPGPPAEQSTCDFLRPIVDVLDALEYLHAHDILHLDVHPGNLILSGDAARGSVLVDFGLAASVDPFFGSRYGAGLGALPPELLKRGGATPSSDVFLVGRLLHYRLTGRMEGEVRLPREIPGWGARLTLDLERIAVKALQREPAQRFPGAREFRAALLNAIGEPDRPHGAVRGREVILGRQRQIEMIETSLRDVSDGLPVVSAFAGKRGVGKSRLLEEARVRAQLRGFEVVCIGGMPDGGSGPALANALGRARGKRDDRSRWLEPLSTRHGGTPQERARRAAEAFFTESSRPLVLVVDDVDRVDRESRTLVDALVEISLDRRRKRLEGRGLGLFLACADRTEFGSNLKEVAVLKPLRRDAARTLLRSLLGSLAVPDALLAEAIDRSGGVPLFLRRLAGAMLEEWGSERSVPPDVELPGFRLPAGNVEEWEWSRLADTDRVVVDVLGIVGRPASCAEIAAALAIAERDCRLSLRRLEKVEALDATGRGRSRRYHPRLRPAPEEIRSRWSETDLREIHLRVVRHLRAANRPIGAGECENIARHLLAAGNIDEGRSASLDAARRLCALGSFHSAVRLLEEAAACQGDPASRVELVERISSILEETGDHGAGIRILEPFCRRELSGVPPGPQIRARRCLGIHYHRAGMADKALAVFEEVRRSADPGRDVEDLVFVDSELAELHTFHGNHEAAEAACRRGLDRLERTSVTAAFRGRMEVILRASLGHLELRRMRLERARDELSAALKLCRRYGSLSTREAVLNNLGVTYNQLNEFDRARSCFEKAERMLLAAGERRGTIKIACNLAVIAAKRGERGTARFQMDRASQTLRYYPDQRLDFFVHYTRGVVAHLLGDTSEATESFERALPLGRELGDLHLVRFGEVYLAEAQLLSGQYQKSLKRLEAAARQAKESAPPLLRRMIHARLLLVETLLGRPRRAARSARAIRSTPRTDVRILEAWNDIFHGLAGVVDRQAEEQTRSGSVADTGGAGRRAAGAEAREDTHGFERALDVFGRFGLPFGAACARLAHLVRALASGDRDAIRSRMSEVAGNPTSGHRFLAVAEPLLRGEAAFVLGDTSAAEEALLEASGAIVGSPFLELDWRLEFLRARVALRRRDVQEARRNFHRCAHTRELLVQLVPAAARERFLRHPRFEAFRRLERHLEKPARVVHSTELLRRAGGFEGMIGQSPAMVEVYRVIDQVAAQEMPVLIRGATGTGKELVARALHGLSTRRQGRFMAIHCAALPGDLFESELFGCARGAYTGAEEDRPGLLEELEEGTVLLDEVSQLPTESQAKLLQAIDSGLVRRVGSVEAKTIDVRFLATTSRDLRRDVDAGRFRADLYYRLGGLEIEIPPLTERREDIVLLARHFLERHAARLERRVPVLTSGAVRCLESYSWPGNVRELESALLRVLLCLSRDDVVTTGDLDPVLAPPDDTGRRRQFAAKSLAELQLKLERDYLTDLFIRVKGDPEKMMEDLGVQRSQLYARFRRLGIDVRSLRHEL